MTQGYPPMRNLGNEPKKCFRFNKNVWNEPKICDVFDE